MQDQIDTINQDLSAMRQEMERRLTAAEGGSSNDAAGPARKRRAASVPATRNLDNDGEVESDPMTDKTVVLSGFPEGTLAKEIKDFIQNIIKPRVPGFKEAYTKGYHTRIAFITFESKDDRRAYLLKFKKEIKEEPIMFKAHDDSTHDIFLNPQLSPKESRRQMVQRLIKKAILSKLSDLTKQDIGIERGRGEVWVRRRKIARVEADGETWHILAGIPEANITQVAQTEEIETQLATK